ncbi:hypothetical protein LRS71_00730 [Rhodococcus pyridinivorans]|uniref:hypothetical protein n=1 Tax=Rhodococcus pyridinivorans TaxID=103816 RepID=UPI001E63407B|nr:hypothetical protein [Rhodococcus pyridinivorans]MCD5418107.1 hypothetical protein [Rhodococcus pyridinivorans]
MPLLALGLVLVTSAPRDRLVVGTLVVLGVSWLGDSAPDLADGTLPDPGGRTISTDRISSRLVTLSGVSHAQ